MSLRKKEKEVLRKYLTPGYLSQKELKKIYRNLFKTRLLEEELYNRKMKEPSPVTGTVFDSQGQEAVSVGIASTLREDDAIAPSHRDAGAYIVRGVESYTVGLQFFAKADSPSFATDLNWHLCAPEKGILRFISHMGALAPMITGVVWGKNYRLEREGKLTDRSRLVGVIFLGEGGSNQGVVFEAMNASSVLDIPVAWIFNLNKHAISTLPEESHPFFAPLSDFSKRAAAFDMESAHSTLGWDVEDVYYKGKFGIEFARITSKPIFLSFDTFRLTGHNRTQPLDYEEPRKQELEYYKARDPIAYAEHIIAQSNLMTKEEVEQMKAEIREEVNTAFDLAEQAPNPEPSLNDIRSPFADPECKITEALAKKYPPKKTERILRHGQAITEAYHQAMELDENVLTFGEDVKSGVGGAGGVYGITKGLTEKFGLKRCFNTPISEAWLIGFGAGLAFLGLKPIIEIQFFPFLTCGFSQLVDIVATHCWQTGIPLPLVIRVPGGFVPSSGNYHSFMEEASILNFPGVKVVFATDAFEAKGLFLSAIADPDPVIVIEQIHAYSRKRFSRSVPEEPYYIPIGKAEVRHQGTNLSIIAYGALPIARAEDARGELLKEGISADIINLRTLKPLDTETLIASYAKTGRAIILHEAVGFAGFSGEITKVLAGPEAKARSRWRDKKEPPIITLAAKNIFVPGSVILEEDRIPSTKEIIETARVLMEYRFEKDIENENVGVMRHGAV